MADDEFFRSALRGTPRAVKFSLGSPHMRYVALTTDCRPDFVANIVSDVAVSRRASWHGKVFRKVTGVRGGGVGHFGRATHIAPDSEVNNTLAIHVMGNYIRGVRDDALRLRLNSALPNAVKEWIGETRDGRPYQMGGA